MRTRLSNDDIAERLNAAPGWEREGNWIRKQFQFPDFKGAVAFVNRVAEAAEAMDHHPDIDVRYNKVKLLTSTHSAGGLTEMDFELARRIDAAAQS